MSKYVIWADQAGQGAVAAPPVDKQHEGWTREAPPFEWLNWHMRRTDTRLAELERPLVQVPRLFPAGERTETIRAGERFAVPEYQVGAERLEVRLDGIVCFEGEKAQYKEVGEVGELSRWIVWNDDIEPWHEILIKAPRKILAPCIILDEDMLSRLPTAAAVVRPGGAPPDNLSASGLIIELSEPE